MICICNIRSSWVVFLQPSPTQFHTHRFHAWFWRSLKQTKKRWHYFKPALVFTILIIRLCNIHLFGIWRNLWPGKSCKQELCPTIISPVTVPGVCSQPVRSPVLLSPSKDLNGVTTQEVPCHMLVHTCSNIALNIKVKVLSPPNQSINSVKSPAPPCSLSISLF